jgi:hypothetical protein
MQRGREVRAAQNQSLFRTVNERLEGLAEAYQFISETASFVCECADVGCVERIELRPSEYEAVRAQGNRFAVRPGHVYPDVERVVGENERFVTVEKTGLASDVAGAASER